MGLQTCVDPRLKLPLSVFGMKSDLLEFPVSGFVLEPGVRIRAGCAIQEPFPRRTAGILHTRGATAWAQAALPFQKHIGTLMEALSTKVLGTTSSCTTEENLGLQSHRYFESSTAANFGSVH